MFPAGPNVLRQPSSAANRGFLRPRRNHSRTHAVSTLERSNPKMNSVIYLIGLVVVVLAILSFLGLN